MSYVKRAQPVSPTGGGAGPPEPCPFFNQLPAIWDFLSNPKYDDGEARQLATLTIFFEEGQIKVCLSDRDQQRTAWASSDELGDCLAGLERSIQDGGVMWRKSRPGQSTPRKK